MKSVKQNKIFDSTTKLVFPRREIEGGGIGKSSKRDKSVGKN